METKENAGLDYALLQKKLGGTIKIGRVFPDLTLNKTINLLPKGLKKIYFGFSVYKLSEETDFKGLERQIKNISLDIKRKFKVKGISCRWVVSKKPDLSSVVIKKNKLLDQGAEIVLFKGKNRLLVGKTLSCQEFEEYSFYDFARPFRTIEKGMIPPKLGKIMINLSSCFKPEAVILDPFCGAGTILQQAILMGYKNIIGADNDQAAIQNTKKNLDWLLEKLKKRPSVESQEDKNTPSQNIKIFKNDVRNISKNLPPRSVDAIVTEPYLGPLKFERQKSSAGAGGPAGVDKEIKKISNLYIDAFKEFKKILKTNGRVVIIFPAYKIGKETRFLPILTDLEKVGWCLEPFLPAYLLKNPEIKITRRQSVIYSRPDQRILREIFIFKLK